MKRGRQIGLTIKSESLSLFHTNAIAKNVVKGNNKFSFFLFLSFPPQPLPSKLKIGQCDKIDCVSLRGLKIAIYSLTLKSKAYCNAVKGQ